MGDVTTEVSRDDRILTIPNFITLARLLCLPVFLWLLFAEENRAAAAWLLGGLGATDFLDGYIARHFDQGSNLGKIIDPVADRLLFFVGIVAIMVDGSIPVIVAVLILAREVFVTIGTLALAVLGARRIDVTWFGKAGTLCNMFAVPFFLGAESTLGWRDTSWVLGWSFAVPGLLLSWYAAALYVPLGRRALAEGRSARAGVGSPP